MRYVMIGVVSLVCLSYGRPANHFIGNWRGEYRSQPPPGTAPGREPAVPFELALIEEGGHISGRFRQAGGSWQPLQHANRFGDRACFGVHDAAGADMRWCIRIQGRRLTGTWSLGPQGGALSDGVGVGVRLFKISGRTQPAR